MAKAILTSTFTIVAVLLLLGAAPPREQLPEEPEITAPINKFTFDFLRYEADASAPANAVFSPQSIYHGMAMSYVGSRRVTRKELAEALHFPVDNAKLVSDLSDLRQQFRETAKGGKIELSFDNAIWLDSTYAEFRPEYIQQLKTGFEASLFNVKYINKEAVAGRINAWVSDKTRGKIPKVVGPEDFASRSSLGIIDEPAMTGVNVVYFKAPWGSRFDKRATRLLPFKVDPSRIATAPMMHQCSLLPYSEDGTFQFLEIPYVARQFSMYVVLPKEVLSIGDLARSIDADRLAKLRRSAFDREVDVLFPKFELTSHASITNALSAMGVRDAFDKGKADFDNMIIKNPSAFRIYVSQVYHDAWIEVHEEGTEAAAATTAIHYSIGCSATAVGPAEFHADHPFLFFIVHNKSRSILFAGWVSQPGERP